jgi:hypothetical protein
MGRPGNPTSEIASSDIALVLAYVDASHRRIDEHRLDSNGASGAGNISRRRSGKIPHPRLPVGVYLWMLEADGS